MNATNNEQRLGYNRWKMFSRTVGYTFSFCTLPFLAFFFFLLWVAVSSPSGSESILVIKARIFFLLLAILLSFALIGVVRGLRKLGKRQYVVYEAVENIHCYHFVLNKRFDYSQKVADYILAFYKTLGLKKARAFDVKSFIQFVMDENPLDFGEKEVLIGLRYLKDDKLIRIEKEKGKVVPTQALFEPQ
jgi:hypothetical protein